MEHAGLNLKEVRSRNKSSLLYLLNADPNLSRKDIAQALSLTPAAVTKLSAELIDNGLLAELGEVESEGQRVGRRRIRLALRLRDYFALCVNAEMDKVTVSLSCLDGTAVKIETVGADEHPEKIIKTCIELLKSSQVEYSRVLCASVCVTGSVNDNSLGLWDAGEMKVQLERATGLPVALENNVKAFALSELIYGRKQYKKSVLFLKWGPGIGSAIATNGEVLSGSDSGVAEIGHYIVSRDGKKCRCGRYGCLETEVSSLAIIREAGCESFDDIIESRTPEILNLIDAKIDLVALALTNTSTILNADKIVLFGSAFRNCSIAQKLSRQCMRYNANLKEDTIELSGLNGRSAFIGPLAVAAKQFFFERSDADGSPLSVS